MNLNRLHIYFITLSCLLLLPLEIQGEISDANTQQYDIEQSTLNQDDFSDDSPQDRYTRLTTADYKKVARELGVDVAAIKAVSSVEGGGQGFVSPGKPTINFDISIFKQRLNKAGISISEARRQAPIAFAGVKTKRYGSYGAAQYARLENAFQVSRTIALESTFWGMFQIGGFNYRQCGCKDVEEMVRLMSQSEAMQLELFARFIKNTGMLKYIRKHDWVGFARAYNGSRYVASYSAKIRNAYNRHR